MVYPATRLPVVVRIAPGADLSADPATWPWVDVTTSVRMADRIVIEEGRGDWGEDVDAGTCKLTFNNPDGHFSEHNPLGQWYGLLGRDTPLLVSLDWMSGLVDLFGGTVPAWVPRSDLSGKIRTVPVTARGVLSRLKPSSGTSPSRSPMRRAIGASAPVAYWPVEDGAAAGQVASALPGHPPLTISGDPEFRPLPEVVTATRTTRYGTSALADLAGGASLAAAVPVPAAAATATAWTVALVTEVPLFDLAGDLVLLELTTPGGTFVRWQLVVRKAISSTQVIAYPDDGVPVTVVDDPGVTASFDAVNLSVWQDGGTIRAGMGWSTHLGEFVATGEVAGTLAGVTGVSVNPGRATANAPLLAGHVTVWAGQPTPLRDPIVDQYGVVVLDAMQSWVREPAHDRLARLCAEDGIPVTVGVVADAGEVTRMGWQAPGTPLDLYRQCEDADGGVLAERPFALAYTPRVALYNQTPALILDHALADLGAAPVPDGSGQGYRNRYEVERIGGSSAVAETADAATGIVLDDSVKLNLATDGVLADHAWWRLHLASTTGLRWPQLTFNLLARPAFIDAWLNCRVGSRIQVVHPPADVAGQDIDVLLQGWTVTLGHKEFLVEANCSPAAPWQVAEVDGVQRVAADGSTLAAPLPAAATSMLLTSTARNGTWTTDPADMPLNVRVGGERVTAIAVGSSLVDTFARSVSGGWGTADTGHVWQFEGGTAADYSVSGGAGVHRESEPGGETRRSILDLGLADAEVLWSVSIPQVSVGVAAQSGLIVRDQGNSDFYIFRVLFLESGELELRISERTAGVETTIANPPGTQGVYAGGTVVHVRSLISGSLLRMRCWTGSSPEPTGWQVEVVDTVHTLPGRVGLRSDIPSGWAGAVPLTFSYRGFEIVNPQLVTLSARGANGVTRDWPAGTPVDVWDPAIVPL